MTVVGAALGFFIGVLCGLAVLLLIRSVTAAVVTFKTTVAAISQLLALPTFSFGGPWVTSVMLQSADLGELLPSYTVALAITFAVVAGFPLFVLISTTSQQQRRRAEA